MASAKTLLAICRNRFYARDNSIACRDKISLTPSPNKYHLAWHGMALKITLMAAYYMKDR